MSLLPHSVQTRLPWSSSVCKQLLRSDRSPQFVDYLRLLNTQRHIDTTTQRHIDTSTQRHIDTSTHRHIDTSTHRHIDTSTHGQNPAAFEHVFETVESLCESFLAPSSHFFTQRESKWILSPTTISHFHPPLTTYCTSIQFGTRCSTLRL